MKAFESYCVNLLNDIDIVSIDKSTQKKLYRGDGYSAFKIHVEKGFLWMFPLPDGVAITQKENVKHLGKL